MPRAVKLITNRWAWELVPRRLAGSKSHKPEGRYPWQPWKREPPKRNLSPGAWRMEGPENRVTWNLQSPMRPQALSAQTSNAGTNSTHLTRWTCTWGVKTGRQNSTLGPTHKACRKSHCRWQAQTKSHQRAKSQENCRRPQVGKQVSCAVYRAWWYPDDLAV